MTEAERLLRAARRADGTIALGELKRLAFSRRRRRSTLLALEELLAKEGLLYAWLHILGGAKTRSSVGRIDDDGPQVLGRGPADSGDALRRRPPG